jgi:hypothetical protein
MQGTRKRATRSLTVKVETRVRQTRSRRDPGAVKRVTGAMTFDAPTGRATGANGLFTPFAVGDQVTVSGVVSNLGTFQVTAIDGVNAAYVTMMPAPKTESLVTATMAVE